MSANGGGRTHSTYGRERPVGHRCGRCANPHTGGRDDCPNAVVYVPLPPMPEERYGVIDNSAHLHVEGLRASQQVPYEEERDG